MLDVAAGKMTFANGVAQSVRALVASPGRGERSVGIDAGRLTRREAQVLKQVEFGLRNQEIASALGISKKTVESHVRSVLLKLGVSSRTQAVAQVLRAAP